MKLLHLSDLHIGKRVNEFSMLEDQEYILNQILDIIDQYQPDGVIIAGDVYDKSIPPAEAVTLFDWFLTKLHEKGKGVYLVSGNHDSSERLEYGGNILGRSNIHIAGTYQGELKKVEVEDSYGIVHIYMLPFIKPVHVRHYYEGVESYQDAVETVISHGNIDSKERNILIAHQFITSGTTMPEESDSEIKSIGGLDNIDAAVFDPFDYVALGHLHGPQRIGRDTVRYGGSPLKYSFSEAKQIKSVTLVELKEKGEVLYEKIPLVPIRDMRVIRGPIESLLDPAVYSKANCEDYIQAILTNEEEIYDAIGKLRSIYPNIMRLEFDNSKSKQNLEASLIANQIEEKNPMELFEEFYEKQNNGPMNEMQYEIMKDIFEEMVGGAE